MINASNHINKLQTINIYKHKYVINKHIKLINKSKIFMLNSH